MSGSTDTSVEATPAPSSATDTEVNVSGVRTLGHWPRYILHHWTRRSLVHKLFNFEQIMRRKLETRSYFCSIFFVNISFSSKGQNREDKSSRACILIDPCKCQFCQNCSKASQFQSPGISEFFTLDISLPLA